MHLLITNRFIMSLGMQASTEKYKFNLAQSS